MRNFKLTIEYDGTDFQGWQVQSEKNRTVQGEIEKVLRIIFKKKLRLIGSGRTDRGVHAEAQTAHFKVATKKNCEEILRAINANLPKDIAVIHCEEAPPDFHAQYSIRRKTYRYIIFNRAARPVLMRRQMLHIPQPLNIIRMRREAKPLLGKHDFKAFTAADPALKRESKNKGTVRTVYRLDVRKRRDAITIEIEADGFLYKMVRNIVGTLLAVGRGKLPPGSTEKILKTRDRTRAPATAPAQGLCLVDAVY